jgi:transposase
MRNKLQSFFVAVAAMTVLLSLSDVGNAQTRRARGVSKQQIEQLLERIEERNDAFTKTFDQALDDSRLDTTRAEERYTDRSRDLENATDELRREFDHNDTRGETSENVRKVLNIATEVNRIMNTRNFGSRAESNWNLLRSELNALARIYNLPAVGARSYVFVAPARGSAVRPGAVRAYRVTALSQQQVEQLLERIEERTDAFSNQLNKSLDRSRLDSTRAEDNIALQTRELENATDELRREFDHNDSRGENLPEARNILRTATIVDRVMARRNFSRQAENNWLSLKAELNTLARIYGIPAVGARNYR